MTHDSISLPDSWRKQYPREIVSFTTELGAQEQANLFIHTDALAKSRSAQSHLVSPDSHLTWIFPPEIDYEHIAVGSPLVALLVPF
jgi:hypothetical protein